MSKQCPICKTENSTDAIFCIKCGYRFLDKELNEEEKSFIDNRESNSVNQDYKFAFGEIIRVNELLYKSDAKNAKSEEELLKVKQLNKQYSNLLSEKEIEIKKLQGKSKGKSNKSILVLSLIFLNVGLIIFTIYLANRPPRVEKRKILYGIAGNYVCNMESPHKLKLKVVISKNTRENSYSVKFLNYDYAGSYASDFEINTEGTEIRNGALGVGVIVENSTGEIEILSKPENEKKWNMRKTQ